MKDNKLIILTMVCAILTCSTIYFGYNFFNQKECEKCLNYAAESTNNTSNNTNENNDNTNDNTNTNDNDNANNTNSNNSNTNSKQITEISFSEFKKKVDKKETFYVYFAQTTCGYCIQFEPTLESVSKQKNIKIVKLNLNLMSNEDRAEFNKLVSIKSTPTVAYYEKGKHDESDRLIGNASASTLEKWIDELG